MAAKDDLARPVARPRVLSDRMNALRDTLGQTRGKSLRQRLEGFEDLFPHLFQNMNLEQEELSGEDLRDLDFSGANLTRAKLDGARILGARFWQARVTQVQLHLAADWPEFASGWAPPGRIAAARACPGDRFLLDPLGPEFMLLAPPGVDAVQPAGVDDATWADWREGRLAIARAPLTVWEAGAARKAPQGKPFGEDFCPALLTPDAVHPYMDWAQSRLGRGIQVPTAALWVAIARLGGLPTVPDARRFVTFDGADQGRLPEPIPQTDEARSNAFGLVDMIGNVREFVRGDDGPLMVVGGDCNDSLRDTLVSLGLPVLPDRAVGRHLAGLRLICRFSPSDSQSRERSG